MLSEQEAKFRTNMFESLSPADAPMMDNLLQQGYHEDEAALIIFENKFPQVQNTHANNNVSADVIYTFEWNVTDSLSF